MKNQIYQVVSVIAIVGYFVPMLIVWIKKLWKINPFLLFALYWLSNGVINLALLIPGLSNATLEKITVIYNMLDMPIILSIFYLTTSAPGIKAFTKIALPVFATIEVINAFIKGMNYEALKYPLAVGLVIVLMVIIWEIILYLQKIQHTGREKALLLIYAALLFEYGTYIVIYIFDYYLENISSSADNFMMYYISSLLALGIAICGFLTKGINKKARIL